MEPPVVDPSVTHKTCGRCVRIGREALHPVDSFGRSQANEGRQELLVQRLAALRPRVIGRGQRWVSLKHIEAVKRYRERRKWGSSAADT